MQWEYRKFLYNHPISPIVNILHYYGPFVTNNELILIHYYSLNSILHLDLINVSLTFFRSRIPSNISHYIELSPLRLLLAMMVFHFPCFLWPRQFWEILVRYVVVYLSVWVCLMFTSWSGWSCEFGGGRWWRRHALSLYQGYMPPTWLITSDLNLDPNYSVCQVSPL